MRCSINAETDGIGIIQSAQGQRTRGSLPFFVSCPEGLAGLFHNSNQMEVFMMTELFATVVFASLTESESFCTLFGLVLVVWLYMFISRC